MSAGVFTGAVLSGLGMDAWGIGRACTVTGSAVSVLSSAAVAMIGVYDKKQQVKASL
jgi:predicted MFS family arabinose efflux permease